MRPADQSSSRRLSFLGEWIAPAAVVLVLGSVLLLAGDANPLVAIQAMYHGSLGSVNSVGETLLRFVPLALVAAGLAPSLRVGLFNIGAPGQIAIGALFATLVSLELADLPSVVVLPVAALSAATGGALWVLLPAVLRARLGVNEILSTLVFNFLALLLLEYLLSGPLQGFRANLAQSETLPETALLPVMLPETRAHFGLVLALMSVAALGIVQRTPTGYRLKLYGENRTLARLAGIREDHAIIGTLLVAGAAAGLAGWTQVAGVDHRLYASVAAPIGYTGLFAALLGNLNPAGICISSLVFAALLTGGDSLQIGANVSPEVINAFVGLILLVLAARSGIFAQRKNH